MIEGLGDPYLWARETLSAPGRRWFAVVDGQGHVDLQLTEWPGPEWAGWHSLVFTSRAAPSVTWLS